MKIQFLSDLHEKYIDITPSAEYLALLGDIGDPFEQEYKDFLLSLSKKFKMVFLVSGNREYYFRTIPETNEKIQEICDETDNIKFLNNSSILVDGFLIIGTTLWTDIDEDTAFRINDFRFIRTGKLEVLTVDAYNNLHQESLKFIEQECEKNIPMIVLSHHAPIKEMNGDFGNMPLWRAFCSDLTNIQKNIKVWISGHTQKVRRIKKNGILYASNCMGFKRHQDFDENSVIDL